MKTKNGTRKKLRRTTISLGDDLMEKGRDRMRQLRRRSFSSYIEDLIASDIEKNREAMAA